MTRATSLVLRILLGGLFVFAGALKIFDPQLFAHEIDQYRLVPHAWINGVAVVLPWLELNCGILLVMGVWVRPAAGWAGLMSLSFLVAVASVLARGLKIKCGCFGTVGASFVGPWHLLLDLFLIMMAVWVFRNAKD